MRASILLWSTASGVILGLFADALLVGVAVLMSAALPGQPARLHQRWFVTLSAVVLGTIPAVFALLGFLEGRLKAN